MSGAVIGIKRGQISRMAGVRAALGVIMRLCVCKGIIGIACAAAALVDMQSEYLTFAFFSSGQTVDRDRHHCFSEIGDKGGVAMYFGIFPAAADNSFCISIYKKHLPYSALYAVWEAFVITS